MQGDEKIGKRDNSREGEGDSRLWIATAEQASGQALCKLQHWQIRIARVTEKERRGECR
jgi:hypothetical protein